MRWCPGCSRNVDAPCHHFNCPLNREDRAARAAGQAAKKQARQLWFIGLAALAFGVVFGIAISYSRQSIQRTRHCERIADSMPLFGDCSRR